MEREKLEEEYARTQRELQDLAEQEADFRRRRSARFGWENTRQAVAASGQPDNAWSRIKIDHFYGGPQDDFESWLFRLNTIASLEAWSEQRQVPQAIVALAGTALSYRANVASADKKDQLSWEDFVKVMRKRFGPSKPIQYWNHKLVTLWQGTQETVSGLLVVFNWHCLSFVHVGEVSCLNKPQ